jgi:signal transduction histidine kinase
MARTIEAQLDALRENDRQRRELVSGLSHDFRTPLTSLRGYAERLQASDASIPDRQALDAILANTQRLTQLASQLSTLSRVDAYEEELQLEPFSLGELACDVAGKFQPQAQSSEVSLTVQCSRDNIQVTADIALIDRALANLVDNALRATPAGGQVQLLVQIRDDKASVSVTDTGVGLSAEEIPLVTQRFYRTESGRERGEGSGLGLAIVQEICERHGTRLTIRSKLGEGTKMQFDLALAQKPDIDNKTAHY